MLSLVAKDAIWRDEPEDAACYQRRSAVFFFSGISHNIIWFSLAVWRTQRKQSQKLIKNTKVERS